MGGTSSIPLGKNGEAGFAIVDNADFEYLNQWKWHKSSMGYARRTENGTKRAVYMHREIANTPRGLDTDHINRNTLDNRRSNLRICSHAENVLNRDFKVGKSGYRGVYWDAKAKSWYAKIQKMGKQYYLGQHPTPEEASLSYKQAAARLFKEFA